MEVIDVARRAAAKYFGIGFDPSYLEFLSAPHMQDVPAVKFMNAVIDAITEDEAGNHP